MRLLLKLHRWNDRFDLWFLSVLEQMDASLFRRAQISSHSYPLTPWAAGKSDRWWHLYLLSVLFFSLPRHKSACVLKCWDTAIAAMIRRTFRNRRTREEAWKTDEPWKKDSIFSVWSPTKNDKSQRETAARRMCKHSQPCKITIQPCNPKHLILSSILALAQHTLVGRKCNAEIQLIKEENQRCICFHLYLQSVQKLIR